MCDTALLDPPALTEGRPMERVTNRLRFVITTLEAQAVEFGRLERHYEIEYGPDHPATVAARDSREQAAAAIAQFDAIERHPHG